jgi:flagellar assembly protein FliH
MKARHKAGIAPPAAVLRGIAMNSQPHALARPPRPSIPSPVKVHALPASMRANATLGNPAEADHKVLQEQAFADGHNEGYAAGRSDALAETLANSRLAIDTALERAVDEGRALGLKEGREAASAELEQARTTLFDAAAAETKCQAERLERLLSGIESQAAKALWDVEDDLVALAHEVICRVLGCEALAPETIRGGVKSLLAQHGQRTRLAVHVHPDDIVALQGNGGNGDPWRWVADQSVELGGVILRSRDGSLDARLETQLAALNETLLAARAERRAQHVVAASLPGDSS